MNTGVQTNNRLIFFEDFSQYHLHSKPSYNSRYRYVPGLSRYIELVMGGYEYRHLPDTAEESAKYGID